MLALSSSYELATTYLQVFLLWMFCSELVHSFSCVYFVITGHFLRVEGVSILRANLASTEKSAAGKVGLTLPRSLPGVTRRINKFLCKTTIVKLYTGLFMYKNKEAPLLALSTKHWPFRRVRLALALMEYVSNLIRTI